MDFRIYQEQAITTAIFPKNDALVALSYVVLGLTNESGEVAGKLKKCIRDNQGIISQEIKNQLRDELGDVLWYLANICDLLGITLEDVADHNISKLLSRQQRNKLHGSGDDR